VVRDALGGLPIDIDSWLRLPELNVAVGGSEVSAHMDGFAVDMRCAKFGSPLAVCKAIVASGIKFDQIIHEYGAWTHLSFAPAMRGDIRTIFRPQRKYLPGLLTAEEYARHFK
jgi:hypothetical protein